MQKFYRNLFAAGTLAVGLAACGDDVTVTNPPPPPPVVRVVHSVTVSPANQTLAINQEVVFSASVNADSGLATSVNWTTSNAAIATVGSDGTVKGIAPGTTTIVATSTADAGKTAAATVTVVPNPPGIVSFNPGVANLTIKLGTGTGSAQALIQMLSGVTQPAITWTSLNTAVVSLGAVTQTPGTGSSVVLNGVAPGNAVVQAKATVGDQNVVANVAVTVLAPPSVSIVDVTSWNSNTPVNISNVFGQIAIKVAVNPRDQELDSVVVYIDQAGAPKSAARQVAPNAAAELVFLVKTNAYKKINAVTGQADVDFKNGATTIRAAVYPKGATQGIQASNCTTSLNAPVCAGNPVAIVLNNQDGWAADLTPGTRSAINTTSHSMPCVPGGGSGNGCGSGEVYYGGPGVEGVATAVLYPVIYTPGRSMTGGASQVVWGVGGCTVGASNRVIGKQTFGYTTGGAGNGCGYENAVQSRDNVWVTSAQDAAGVPYSLALFSNTALNTGIPGSTPDSVRFDWAGPGVVRPAVDGAESFNWVNQNWVFMPAGTKVTDQGVGPVESTWTAYASVQAGTTGTSYITAITTGGDAYFNETNTNCVTPSASCFTADGYTARATAGDKLTNSSNSGVTSSFGVDWTAPVVRYSTTTTYGASLYVNPAVSANHPKNTGAAIFDSIAGAAQAPVVNLYGVNVTTAGQQERFVSTAAGTADSLRLEAQDNRSGLSKWAQRVNRFRQDGPTGQKIDAALSWAVSPTFLAATADGWLPAPAYHVTNGTNASLSTTAPMPGYYTYYGYVIDRAGNVSGCPYTGVISGSNCTATLANASTQNPAVRNGKNTFIRNTLAVDGGAPQVIGVSPTTYTAGADANFLVQSQDDLEVIDARLRLEYPNLTIGNDGATAAPSLAYTYALGPTGGSSELAPYFPTVATRFDSSIIGLQSYTLTVASFKRSVQETCTASGGPGMATGPASSTECTVTRLYGGDPIPVTDIALAKPNLVGVKVRDVFGSWFYNTLTATAADSTGVSVENTQALLPLSTPTVGAGFDVTYAAVNGGGCPAGGAATAAGSATCVSSGINWRSHGIIGDPTAKFRAVQPLSQTTPVFKRVELYRLDSNNQWVYQAACDVPGSISPSVSTTCTVSSVGTITGSDNGRERYWDFAFSKANLGVPTGANYFPAPVYRAIGIDANGQGLFSTVLY